MAAALSWGSHLPRGEDTPGGRGNNPELPADPFSRAQELGLITKLMDPGSDGQRGISFQELAADHAHGQGGGADAAELEAVLRALVELRVVAEDDPKTYRLLAPDGPSAAAGTAPLVRPEGQSYGDEAATTKVVAPKDASDAPISKEHVGVAGAGHGQPAAWPGPNQVQYGHHQSAGPAIYPMYTVYPLVASPQFYPQMTSAAASSGIPVQNTGTNSQEVHPYNTFHAGAIPLANYVYSAARPTPTPANTDASGKAHPASWDTSMGTFTAPPPPPPPRPLGGPSFNSQAWPTQMMEGRADPADPPQQAAPAPQPSSSGKAPCAFFLKTGTCAYGDKCKFDHPVGRRPPQLNSLGYPIRPSEMDCVYFMKRGFCGFGITCKFNHPEPHSTPWQPHPNMSTPVPGMVPAPHMVPFTGMVSAAMMPMIGYPPGGLQAPIPQGGGAGGVAAVQPSPTQPACAVPGWGGPIPPPHPHSMGISPTGMGVPPPMMMMMQLMTTSDRHPKPHHQLRQVAASPTAHLHEILGISASRSRATSEGVGASGGQETPVSPESARADKPSLSAARNPHRARGNGASGRRRPAGGKIRSQQQQQEAGPRATTTNDDDNSFSTKQIPSPTKHSELSTSTTGEAQGEQKATANGNQGGDATFAAEFTPMHAATSSPPPVSGSFCPAVTAT